MHVGPPIGVTTRVPYEAITVAVPAQATLIAFTDGLVERRGEDLDHGLGRLQKSAAGANGAPLDDVLTTMVTELTHDAADDDTAILGFRWLT